MCIGAVGTYSLIHDDSIAAIGLGAVMPAFAFIFGELFNIFVTQTNDEIRSSSAIVAAIFVGIAVFNFVFSYVSNLCWVSRSISKTVNKHSFLEKGAVGEQLGVLLGLESLGHILGSVYLQPKHISFNHSRKH